MKNKFHILFYCFFVGLSLAYYGVSTTYTHMHVANGVSVSHSHPFGTDSQGTTRHQHAVAVFYLIQGLSLFFIIPVTFLADAVFRPVCLTIMVVGAIRPFASIIKFRAFSPRPPSFGAAVTVNSAFS